MASVTIKSTKNSRTHDILPVGWSLCEVYEAERMDNTHWKIFQKRGPGYVIWPVEDVQEVDDLGPREQPVPVELNVTGIAGPRRISGGGPNMQQIAKTSDGGSSPYYAILPDEKDAQDIIERKGMNFARGNVFKAAWRMGEKDVASELYDWRKIKWFAEREIARLEKASG